MKIFGSSEISFEMDKYNLLLWASVLLNSNSHKLINDMSRWAIDATNRIRNETVPGSSKYILRELSEQFAIASTNIEGHYLQVRNDANHLESWMKRVVEGGEDVDGLIKSGSPKRVPPQLSSSFKTDVQNVLPSPKSREVTIKIPLEPLESIQAEDVIKSEVCGTIVDTNDSIKISPARKPTRLSPHATKQTGSIKHVGISKIHPLKEPVALLGTKIDPRKSPVRLIPPTTPKQSLASSDSEDSFQAISAAIKRNVLEKELTLRGKSEGNLRDTIQCTPRRPSSKFVPLPARTPIVLNRTAHAADEMSTKPPPIISIKNKFSPRKLPAKRNSPIPKLVKVPLSLQAIVIPPNSDTFEPSHLRSSFEVSKDEQPRSSASLWGKIGEYRQLSPKKPPQSSPMKPPRGSSKKPLQSSPKRSPQWNVKRSPVHGSSPLRQQPSLKSPSKIAIPQLKSPKLDHVAAPTVSSAAKRKKQDVKKFENRFLTTTLQRTPRTFDRAKSTKVMEKPPKAQPKVDIQRPTKKSMMEQRSEAAALKARQKIVLNLRKSESKVLRDEVEQVEPPKTPVKYTPDNLPDVHSDDNHSPSSKVLQPWGSTPELYRIAKSKKKVDPFKIFHKSNRVNLLEVFNKHVTAQSPAPTPDEYQAAKYSKSMGFH